MKVTNCWFFFQSPSFSAEKTHVEDALSPLYRAARIVLMQRVHHFTELVPKVHQVRWISYLSRFCQFLFLMSDFK